MNLKTEPPRHDSIDDAELRRRHLRILRRILAALQAEAAALGVVPENLTAHIEATQARIAVLAKESEG